MTADIPHEQPDHDPFEALRADAIDPVLAEVMGNAAEAQMELQGRELNWEIVHDVLEMTNELWASTNYVGALGRFSGKLRESYRGAKDDPVVSQSLGKLTKGTDEHGEYWLAHNLPLISSYFTVATGEQNELDASGRVGLSAILPEAYMDEDDDYIEAGDLLLYLDEIDVAEFARPNVATIGKQLAYHFPQLHRELLKMLPEGVNPSEAKITKFLHEFYIPADESLYHNYPIVDRLNAHITSRLEFDGDQYEVGIYGPVYGVDDDEQEIAAHAEKYHNHTIRGIVAGVVLRKDDELIDGREVYRPNLLLAVPEAAKDGGYYACIVPPESLVRLRSIRRQNTQFGKAALHSFETVAEMVEFFAEPLYDDEEDQKPGLRENFAALTDALKAEMPQVLSYDKQHRRYEISLERDMNAVVTRFTQLLEVYGKQYPDRPLGQTEYVKIDKQITAMSDYLKDLMPGDRLATRGDIFYMEMGSDGRSQPVSVRDSFSLHGNFKRFDIIDHPTIILMPGMALRMVNGGMVASVCAVLTDCKVVDGDGVDKKYEFGTEEILVPVIAGNTDRFIKLEQLDGETDERA